jgi:DNA-directed RNA polymerase I, II, and III subunit RPABC1
MTDYEATLVQMLRDRGFQVQLPKKKHMWIAKPEESKENVILPIKVDFVRECKVSVEHIREWEKELTKYSTIIIVFDESITPPAKAAANAWSSKMQFFHVKELYSNITQHALVPEHRLLKSEEVEAVLKKYRVTKQQLPLIPVTDPVIKYWGFPVGGVVHVKRRFGVTIGDETYYRLIVKNV